MLKKFIFRTLLWFTFAFAVVTVYAFYLYYTGNYQRLVFGSEIYYSLKKSNRQSNSANLLIGDSTAKLFFDNNEEDSLINSLACNHGTSMAGKYIFVKNYLEAGNRLEHLVILCSPLLLQNDLKESYTYNYFIKPFFTRENQTHFTETVRKRVNRIPYTGLAQLPWVKTTSWTPYFHFDERLTFELLSPVTIEYLLKLEQLAEENDFSMLIVSSPVSPDRKQNLQSMRVQQEIEVAGLSTLFRHYFDTMTTIDEKHLEANLHVSKRYLEKGFRDEFRKYVLEKVGE